MRRGFEPISEGHAALLGRIAANARRLRARASLTQAAVAERCGLSLFTYQCVEAGETSVTSTTLALLCEGLAVDVREFFEPADAPPRRRRGRPSKEAAPSPVAYEIPRETLRTVAEPTPGSGPRRRP
jgi:transcriptional regulator with XRE-family HTH domain